MTRLAAEEYTVIAATRLGVLLRDRRNELPLIIAALRENGLIDDAVSDIEISAVIAPILNSHQPSRPGILAWAQPEEVIRVALEPFLSAKGREWAIPLVFLRQKVEKKPRRWWRFWER